MFIVKPHLHVIQHAELLEQTDILKCSGNSRLADINRLLPGNIRSVQEHLSAVRFIHTGQKVKHRRLPGPIRSDQPVKFFFLNRNIKRIHRTETAE